MKYIDCDNKELLNIFDFNSYVESINLNEWNHEQSNGFILENTAREMLNFLDDNDFDVLGFTDAPYADYDADKAIILFDKQYDDIKWCHVSASSIIIWRCSLTKEDPYELIREYDIKNQKHIKINIELQKAFSDFPVEHFIDMPKYATNKDIDEVVNEKVLDILYEYIKFNWEEI